MSSELPQSESPEVLVISMWGSPVSYKPADLEYESHVGTHRQMTEEEFRNAYDEFRRDHSDPLRLHHVRHD